LVLPGFCISFRNFFFFQPRASLFLFIPPKLSPCEPPSPFYPNLSWSLFSWPEKRLCSFFVPIVVFASRSRVFLFPAPSLLRSAGSPLFLARNRDSFFSGRQKNNRVFPKHFGFPCLSFLLVVGVFSRRFSLYVSSSSSSSQVFSCRAKACCVGAGNR